MGWRPYQDQQDRAYSRILTTLFPEQTRTLPRILVWSLIFLMDLIAVVCAATAMGWTGNGALLLPVLLGLFWIQGWLWGKLSCLFAKRKENRHDAL